MIEVKARKQYEEKYKEGFPLVVDTFVFANEVNFREGEIFVLSDHKNRFIAKGYLGKQNKSLGWLLSWKENEAIDRRFFTNKLIVALNKRVRFFKDDQTTAFRVFNSAGDGIGGLTIDYFDEYYLFNWYSEGIYAFRDEIIDIFKDLVAYKGIYEKKRFDSKGKYIDDDDFVMGSPGDFPLIVKENGVNIAVDLNDGAMVGVFLDQREVRKTIRDFYSKGKSVLNTFSYTGVFSVFSIMGGATLTESVDLANRSLNMTIEQMTINDIDYEKHNIVVQDVFNYFDIARKEGKKFDLVILDPPSYAKSKKFTFSAAKDYTQLIEKALDLTKDNGIIVASTNHSGVTHEKFKEMIEKGYKNRGSKALFLESFGLPSDFKVHPILKASNYLKVYFVKRK